MKKLISIGLTLVTIVLSIVSLMFGFQATYTNGWIDGFNELSLRHEEAGSEGFYNGCLLTQGTLEYGTLLCRNGNAVTQFIIRDDWIYTSLYQRTNYNLTQVLSLDFKV